MAATCYNAGAADGLWLGETIKPGEILPCDAGANGDTLGELAYNGEGTELLITTIN
jgi:hypothetical protein